MSHASGNGPALECDLVMKGGITSGVIYPKLISTLSSVYRFRSIGGTSAGAIAAAAAAAAQLGVNAGTNRDAFNQLAQLPEELAGSVEGKRGSKLLNLFQPQRKLRPHFGLLTGTLNAGSGVALVGWLALAAIRRFPLGALVGALPGIVLLCTSWGAGWWIGLIILLLGAVVGGLAAGVLSLARHLPGNAFGLCSGMPGEPGKGPLALTPWLHQYLNQLAGKEDDTPLTFGELTKASVELKMITTALNLGRPYRIPFDSGDIYFVAEELQRFFPEAVVRWLVEHARDSETASKLSRHGARFHALPVQDDFPVVVGVRLSLSFPILLSALPLYTVDRTLDVNKAEATRATRVYFSDGGISSNFPVHFFDSPLPTRPTFGVNLKGFHPDHPGERVFLPELLRNNKGLKNYVPPIPDRPGFGSIFAFLGAIASTMRSWRDQLQLAMPGFRDRIVHVSHSDKEGGLNLDMPRCTIEVLAGSGGDAAEQLIAAFAVGGGAESPNGWDNHRRIRARVLLSALQGQLARIADVLEKPLQRGYDQVILEEHPPSYDFARNSDASEGLRLLQGLQRLSRELKESGADLTEDAPRPAPEARLVPRI